MAGAFLYIGNIFVFFRLMAMALIGITMTWMTSCKEGKSRIPNGYLESLGVAGLAGEGSLTVAGLVGEGSLTVAGLWIRSKALRSVGMSVLEAS